MRFDFSNVPSNTLIPEGKYGAKILKHETKDNKAKDGKVLWVTLEVETDAGKQKLTDFFSLKQEALWKLKGLFDAVGIDTTQEEGEEAKEIELDDMIGSEVVVQVIKEKYEGEDRNKIKKYEAVSF